MKNRQTKKSFLLALMIPVLCLVFITVPVTTASAQTYYTYGTLDAETYYYPSESYISPVSYSYNMPVSYSDPVPYSSSAISVKGRYVNGDFHVNDSAKYDRCPRCGTYHLPKGSRVSGIWRNATHSGVHVSFPQNSYSETFSPYVSYSSFQSRGGCRDGFCNQLKGYE